MDKQDKLAQCILPILHKKRYTSCATSELTAEVAAAVRSFMGSDEMVERLALFNVAAEIDDRSLLTRGWGEYPYVDEAREHARAALSAAIGEDIGGGRG